jgi:hypothetical protein
VNPPEKPRLLKTREMISQVVFFFSHLTSFCFRAEPTCKFNLLGASRERSQRK